MDPAMHNYDELYAAPQPPPWDIGEPQPELAALIERIPPEDPVLDAGCGTGHLSILLARKGHRVSGIDSSTKAIAIAQRNAIRAGVEAQFTVVDATQLAEEDIEARTVFDSGLLHSLTEPQRHAYAAGLATTCPAGSVVHVLAMSIDAGLSWGMTSHELEQPFLQAAWTDIVVGPAQILARSDREKIRLSGHLLSAKRSRT